VVLGVGAPVAVVKEPIGSEAVVVTGFGGGPNRDRELECPRFESPLLSEERASLTPMLEAPEKQRPRRQVAMELRLPGKPVKGGEADVAIGHRVGSTLSLKRANAEGRALYKTRPHSLRRLYLG
jgi:hypothetical protein